MIHNYHWVTYGPLSFDFAPMKIDRRGPNDLLIISWDICRANSVWEEFWVNGKILKCLPCWGYVPYSSRLSKSPSIIWGNLKFLIVCVQFPERACGAVPGQLLTLFVFSTPGMKHFIVYYIIFCLLIKSSSSAFQVSFPLYVMIGKYVGLGKIWSWVLQLLFYILGPRGWWESCTFLFLFLQIPMFKIWQQRIPCLMFII